MTSVHRSCFSLSKVCIRISFFTTVTTATKRRNIASGQEATVGMRMQLVAQGEGGPQDLPNMMHYWIEKEQCIPGFMASITLESWEKHKSGGGT